MRTFGPAMRQANAAVRRAVAHPLPRIRAVTSGSHSAASLGVALVPECDMLDERYPDADHEMVSPERTTAPSAASPAGREAGPSRSSVESVPSDQLWRDAVLATRQAASSAAELRRALDASVARALPPAADPGQAASMA